jgi:hypothetical protein
MAEIIPLKIGIHDAHDRLTHLKSHDHSIGECCQNLIDKEPFGKRPFYIFAHGRLDDDGINTRVIWQPRLTKPLAQTNSMLFKGYPGSDRVDILWIIPKRELWAESQKDKLAESEIVTNSIHAFKTNRAKLEAPDEDDPNDAEVDAIYRLLALEGKRIKMMNNLYIRA